MLSVSAYALENLDNSLTAEVHILYDNEYYETTLIPNKTLNISLTISNSGEPRDLVCIFAEYDSQKKLASITSNSTISVPANENIIVNLTKTLINSNTSSAKIFLWEEDNIKPITSCILLQPHPTDYYADIYTSAQS